MYNENKKTIIIIGCDITGSTLVKGGTYFRPGQFQEWRDYPVIVKSNYASHDSNNAKKLWEISEDLTKINYDFVEEKNED